MQSQENEILISTDQNQAIIKISGFQAMFSSAQ